MKGLYCSDQTCLPVFVNYDKTSGTLSLFMENQTLEWNADLVHKKLSKEHRKYKMHYHTGLDGHILFPPRYARRLTHKMKDRGIYREGSNAGNYRAWKVILIGLIPLLCIPIGLYFFGIDFIAKQVAYKIPVNKEVELGRTIYDETLKKYPMVDVQRSLLVDSFFKALGYTTQFPVKITVVSTPEVNAFALPGGHIFVMSGLLNQLDSAGQLAALLSHELSHINERHAARGVLQNAGGLMVLSALVGDLDAALIAISNNLKTLSYSRSMEDEADAEGYKLMAASGKFHPRGMIQLFDKLDNQDAPTPPRFWSTHPNTADRRNHLTDLINQSVWVDQNADGASAIFNQIRQLP